MRAWIASCVLLGLVVGFVTLTFRPLSHPNVYLCTLATSNFPALQAPPLAYTAEDVEGFSRLSPGLADHQIHSHTLRSPGDLSALARELGQLSLVNQDVLLLYIAAHGVTHDGVAYLLCEDFSTSTSSIGRVPVADVLRVLSAQPAGLKLLLIDAGRWPDDVRLGMLANDFASRLIDEVTATGDPSIWAISAQQTFEASRRSRAARRSVFGHVAQQGLAGAADLNDDRQVTLDEFWQLVSTEVSAWSACVDGPANLQRPVVAWGGGTLPAKLPATIVSAVMNGELDTLDELTENAKRDGALWQRTTDELAKLNTPATDEPDNKAASTDKPATPAAATPPVTPTAAEQVALELALGWQQLTAWDTRRWYGMTPAEFAPHAWRATQEWWLWQEWRFRAGAATDLDQLLGALRGARQRLEHGLGLASGKSVVTGVPPCIEELVAAVPSLPLPRLKPQSLAEQRMFSAWQSQPLDAEVTAASEVWQRLSREGTRDEWQQWLDKLGKSVERWDETQFARRVISLTSIDDALLRAALQTRQLSQLAEFSDADDFAWLEKPLQAADQLRLAAEQELFDQAGPERLSDASRWFNAARQLYEQIHTQQGQLVECRARYWRLLGLAPQYIRWIRQSAGTPGERSSVATLRELLDGLQRQAELGESPSSDRLADYFALDERLQAIQRKLDQSLSIETLAGQTRGKSQPGQVARIEARLATTLIPLPERLMLLAAVPRVEAELLSTATSPTELASRTNSASQLDWQQVLELTELERQWVRLGHDPALSDKLTAIDAALDTFRQQLHDTTDVTLDQHEPRLWTALQSLGASFVKYYHALPQVVELRSNDDRAATNRVRRLLALVDPRDAVAPVVHDRLVQRTLANWRAAQLAERSRAVTSQHDAPLALQAWNVERRQQLEQRASLVPAAGVNSPVPQIAVRWQLPERFDLSQTAELPFEIEFTNIAGPPQELRLLWKYDPTLIDIHMGAEWPTLSEAALRNVTQAKNVNPHLTVPPAARPLWYPIDELCRHAPPTVRLSSGDKQTIRGTVRAVGRSSRGAKIIAKLISADALDRREIDVALPLAHPVSLVISGVGDSVAPVADAWRLQPFPNRDTAYQLSLTNQTTAARDVSVRLLAPDAPLANLPTSALSAEHAAQWLREAGSLRTLAQVDKLMLSGDDRAVAIPFPAPPPAEAPAANVTAPPRDLSKSLDHGLLVAVTDLATQQQSFFAVNIATLRPRRFVLPQVRYNPEQERIEINVLPVDRARLPSGSVRVSAEIVEPLAPGALKRLQGTVQAPDYRAQLYAEAPLQPDRVYTVRVAIDDYPRAFVYRVRSGDDASEVAEWTDLHEVRITSPAADTIVRAPQPTIDVTFEVDAPPTAFSQANDGLEIGIDEDRSRDFNREATTIVRQDRQVELDFQRVGPQGLFVVRAAVHDFRLQLPTQNVQNCRAAVLARLITDDQSWWSTPREIVFDGEGPRIERVELSSTDAIEFGKPARVIVTATDGALSGVGNVEASFDPAQSGVFAKEPPPVSGSRQVNGAWLVEVPTAALKSGVWPLLVRATDRAQNTSEYRTIKVRVATAEEIAAERAARTNRVAGRVTYGDQGFGDIKVTLANEAGKSVAEVKTDERGNFLVAAIPPGKYQVKAQGIVRNKQRSAEATITVEPPPQASPPLRLIVK